jgi:hypothetical protein
MSQVTQCAIAIRKELKESFPGIKFSVKSESFSMGNAVTIRPQQEIDTCLVWNLVTKYQYGSFDSNQDMYENTNRRNDLPQAKYVTVETWRG